MNRIKLLHITTSLKMGGAEKILYTLASHLDSGQFEQQVIYFHDGPYLEKLRALGIRTHHIKGMFFRYDPIFFLRLYRLIKKLNPDCIHTLLWVANFAGRLCAWMQKIPCVSVFHNNVDQDGAVRNMLDRLTLRFAQKLVAVSDPVAAGAKKIFGCSRAIEVIPNGLDFKPEVHASKTRTDLGFAKDHLVVGSVGRFEPVKRYDFLLACMARVIQRNPQVRLCLIGLGSQEDFLRKTAHELGIAEFVVFIIGQPAQPYYPLFDCFAQTTAKEGFSLTALEAMQVGVPCVVMDDAMRHPVVSDQIDGIVVRSDDHEGFEAAIERVLADKELAMCLGAAGREKARSQFGATSMVQSYERLFLGQNDKNSF